MFVSLNVWNQEEGYIHSGEKAIIANQTSDVIKDFFFTKDKGRALELVAKTTPDYLPTYDETNENKYDLYGEKVIQNNHFSKKRAAGLNLVVDIGSNEQGTIGLPVIVYEETQLITGGKVLSKEQFELSSIGTTIIPTNIIKDNQVQVNFTANYLYFFVYATVFFWLVVVSYYLLKTRKYSVRYHLFQRSKRT